MCIGEFVAAFLLIKRNKTLTSCLFVLKRRVTKGGEKQKPRNERVLLMVFVKIFLD